jgi:uncharacterized membrane protein
VDFYHLKKLGEVEMVRNPNIVKALIRALYERGEINEATYEKAVAKLQKEVKKYECSR